MRQFLISEMQAEAWMDKGMPGHESNQLGVEGLALVLHIELSCNLLRKLRDQAPSRVQADFTVWSTSAHSARGGQAEQR